ncbi:MAG TPA: MarR family winged helix-turn-helix transcriptional regulator [Myxococcales bacterium]
MNRPQAFPVAEGSLPRGSSVLEFLRLLWAIDHGLQQHSRRMTRNLGVTGVQRLAIRVLGRYPKLTPGQLAELLHLHPSTVTGIVQRLQRGGFVLRRIDRSDRRRSRLALTAKGRAIDARRGGTVESELEAALQKIDPASLVTAEQVLTAIGEQLAKTPARGWNRAAAALS